MAYLRLRQVCLVAPNLAAAAARLESVLGLQPCHRDPNLARYGLENVLFPVGHDFIEIVSPIQPDTAAGRFLAQRGGRGGYMVIFDCDDPHRRGQHAQDLGIRIASTLAHETYLGVQLHPRDTGAAMIEFNHTEGGDDVHGPYHPAGPDWQQALRGDVTTRLLAVDIDAADPAALAAHWARILEVPLLPTDGGRHELAVGDGKIRFSHGSAPAIFSGIDVQVVDPARVRQAAVAAGCIGSDGGIDLCGIRVSLSR